MLNKTTVTLLPLLLLLGSFEVRAAELERINRTSFVAGGTQPGQSVGDRNALSADGRYLLFATRATAVIPGLLDLNGREDVFRKDLELGQIELISAAVGPGLRTADGPSSFQKLSANGRYAVFSSGAANLVPGFEPASPNALTAYWRDAELKLTRLVSHAALKPSVALFSSPFNLEISGDGRFVAFESTSNASLFVPGSTDTNNGPDLFLWDSQNDTFQLMSHVPGNRLQATPTPINATFLRFSADGSTLAFVSINNTLVPGDALGFKDVFLYDRVSGNYTLASHAAGMPTAPANQFSPKICALSPSGQYLLFESFASDLDAGVTDTNATGDVFVFDRDSGMVELISRVPAPATAAGNGASACSSFSADARLVYFQSSATNLVSGIADTSSSDFFVRDRQSGVTRLITHPYFSTTESTGNAASGTALSSADGGLFIFASNSTDLLPILHSGDAPWTFRYDPALEQTTAALESIPPPAGTAGNQLVDLSAGGTASVFLTPNTSLLTTAPGLDRDYSSLVQRLSSESQANLVAPAAFSAEGTASFGFSSFEPVLLSGDGSKVVFGAGSKEVCGATPGPKVCLYDRPTRTYRNINHYADSPQNAAAENMQLLDISGQTGRFVLVQSLSPQQTTVDTNGTWDIFLYDTLNAGFEVISQSFGSATTTANGNSYQDRYSAPRMMSADAGQVAFESRATDLVAGLQDNNAGADIYLRDRVSGTTRLVSSQAGQLTVTANGESGKPIIAALGFYVAYVSAATDLLPNFSDGNAGGWDVYLFDVAAGSTTLVSHAAGSATQGANSDGRFYHPQLSAGGRFVAYTSGASDLIVGGTDANAETDVFRFDRATGSNTLVSHAAGLPGTSAAGSSSLVGFSSDGRYILLRSSATDLLPGQTSNAVRLFLWDGDDNSLRLVSHRQGDDNLAVAATNADLSPDAGKVFFLSSADNVVPGVEDKNGKADLFVWDKESDQVELLTPKFGSHDTTSQGGCELLGLGRVLDDERGILFKCMASDLLPHDNSFGSDLFLALLPDPLFADGFEAGDTSAWSTVLP